MLENAGANVFTPRERDTQKNEVIVDNDTKDGSIYLEMKSRKARWETVGGKGFASKKRIYKDGENPFLDGTVRYARTEKKKNKAFAEWIPTIPQTVNYALVVLDYNLNNKWDFLSRIERKDKCELLINACCVPNCPRRGEHYKCIAQQQKIVLMNRKLPKDKQLPVPGWHCEYGDKNSIFKIKDYETYISPEAIFEKYVPLGFNNFKIEGRTGNLFNLIESYCLWLMKPEKRDEGRFMLITNLQATKVINVGQPRPGVWP